MRASRWPSFDVVRSGYMMCTAARSSIGRFQRVFVFHGRKGFVRHLTRAEVDDLARRVDAIYCTGCGAPVDIRKDHACPHRRAAFSLIDPEAVKSAKVIVVAWRPLQHLLPPTWLTPW